MTRPIRNSRRGIREAVILPKAPDHMVDTAALKREFPGLVDSSLRSAWGRRDRPIPELPKLLKRMEP